MFPNALLVMADCGREASYLFPATRLGWVPMAAFKLATFWA